MAMKRAHEMSHTQETVAAKRSFWNFHGSKCLKFTSLIAGFFAMKLQHLKLSNSAQKIDLLFVLRVARSRSS